MIEFNDTLAWLSEQYGGEEFITTAELIGMLTDIANGVYDAADLNRNIVEYKEHNA